MMRRPCSANEVLQLARKACIGSGLAVDRADDLAEAVVLLQCSGHDGLAHLLDLLRRHQAASAQMPAAVQIDLPVRAAGDQTDQLPKDQLPTDQLPTDQLPTDQLPKDQLPKDQLMVSYLRPQTEGVAVIDWLLANPDTGTAVIRKLDHAVMLVGLLACAVQRYGGMFVLQVQSEAEPVKIADLSVLTDGLPAAAGWTLSYQAGTGAALAGLYHHTDTQLSVWQALEARAQLTYVPATQASRQKGAGAGLVDND